MDDYGKDRNYAVKLLLGILIGLIVIMFALPLVANMVATQTVADASNDALASIADEASLPVSTGNILPDTQTVPIENNTTGTQNNTTTSNNSGTTQNTTGSNNADNTKSTDDMRILSGSITSSSSGKSVCKVYVGSEYSGSPVQISTLYSCNGTDLNPGKKVSVTVDSNGYITVNAANTFDDYPDECMINIYDSSGNSLDSKYVSLTPESGTQTF